MSDGVLSSTVAYRVRFDESGPSGTLRASTLLRYAQDAAWIHSERLGFDRDWYAGRGLTWVVRCAEVEVLSAPLMGETLTVTTTIAGYRRVWARRWTEMLRADGRPAATVLTDWVITDGRGAPTRVPPEFVQLFGEAVGGFEPARVALPAPPDTAIERRFEVRPHELDPLAHANNAVYVDWLHELVAEVPGGPGLLDREPRRYRLEYAQAAAPGMDLMARAWPFEGGIAYRLTGDGGDGGVELLRATVGPPRQES